MDKTAAPPEASATAASTAGVQNMDATSTGIEENDDGVCTPLAQNCAAAETSRSADAPQRLEAPADFAPEDADRESLWASLPDVCKEYICKQQAVAAVASAQQERVDELNDIVEHAWAARFKDAQTFKLSVLQKAHKYMLKRLRATWDGHRFSAGASRAGFSIQSLDTCLLERILKLVPGFDEGWDDHAYKATRRDRTEDMPWHVRRVCCQVCRLFEALIYANVESTYHGLGGVANVLPPVAPPGFIVRDIQRTVLSTALTALDLYIPPPSDDARLAAEDIRAAADALPLCTALRNIRFYVSASDHWSTVIPGAFTAALPKCTQLTHLVVAGYNRGHDGFPRLTHDSSMSAFFSAVTALRSLECLACWGLDLNGIYHALTGAITTLTALSHLELIDATCQQGWLRLTQSTRLRNLGLDNSDVFWEETLHPGGAPGVNLGTSIQTILLRGVHLSEACQLRLAERLPELPHLSDLQLCLKGLTTDGRSALVSALPGVRALTALTLAQTIVEVPSPSELHELFAPLPRCKSLASLGLEGVCASSSWTFAIASVLPQCTALTSLLFASISFEDDDEEGPSPLTPLFDAFPKVPLLRTLTLRRISLVSHDVAILCAALRRCTSLEHLEFDCNDMSSASSGLIDAVASLLSVSVDFGNTD